MGRNPCPWGVLSQMVWDQTLFMDDLKSGKKDHSGSGYVPRGEDTQ